MATVELIGVEKTYANGVAAVRGVDLAVGDGELIVIVGPSGCGKSTLLRMVAGLESVTGGAIRIGKQVVNKLEPAQRDIAMVFQNYALYPHMSVRQNMAYGLRNRGTPKAEIARRVAEAAEILGLQGLLDRKPRQLSGGQRQRVAMGRAIVREPSAFLFDEPLSNLDAKLRVHTRLEIKKLQQRLGTTSLYVTHDQLEAMTLADRMVVMKDGRAEQIGTPAEIYARPATAFVAGFMGSPAMNLLDARLGADGRRIAVEGSGAEFTLAAPVETRNGATVTLGFRPEHVELAPAPNGDEGWPLSVELVEPLGSDTLIHGRIGQRDELITARAPGDSRVALGETVFCRIAPGGLHLFDAATGNRIGPAAPQASPA